MCDMWIRLLVVEEGVRRCVLMILAGRLPQLCDLAAYVVGGYLLCGGLLVFFDLWGLG